MAYATGTREAKIVELAGMFPQHADLALECIRNGTSASEARRMVLEALAGTPVARNGRRSASWLEAAGDLLAMRACDGRLPGRLAPEDRTRRERAAEQVEATLPGRGSLEEIADLTSKHLVDRVHPDVQFRAFGSASDFPLLLADSLSKIAEGFFVQGEASWRPIARIATVRDFRAGKSIRLDVQDMTPTPDGVPVAQAVPREAGEAFQVRTWTEQVSISFQAITNDPTGSLRDTGRAIADAALRTVSAEVYRVLAVTTNRSEDGKPLFASDHPSGSNTMIASVDSAGVAAVSALVRNQWSIVGEPANLRPTHLLCASAQEQAAKALMSGQSDPLVVLADARVSAGTFFIIAAGWPGLELQTLFGDLVPRVSPGANPNGDPRARVFNAVLDFGASVVDHRAIARGVPA